MCNQIIRSKMAKMVETIRVYCLTETFQHSVLCNLRVRLIHRNLFKNSSKQLKSIVNRTSSSEAAKVTISSIRWNLPKFPWLLVTLLPMTHYTDHPSVLPVLWKCRGTFYWDVDDDLLSSKILKVMTRNKNKIFKAGNTRPAKVNQALFSWVSNKQFFLAKFFLNIPDFPSISWNSTDSCHILWHFQVFQIRGHPGNMSQHILNLWASGLYTLV